MDTRSAAAGSVSISYCLFLPDCALQVPGTPEHAAIPTQLIDPKSPDSTVRAFKILYLWLPMKNSASVPGPE